MAHKKGVGSTDNGRDSNSKRLGVKLFGSQLAKAGNIIVRQRGTKFHPGLNVYMGKDFTLHAKVDGTVKFTKSGKNRTFVNIEPTNPIDHTITRVRKSQKGKNNTGSTTTTAPDTTTATADQEVANAKANQAEAKANTPKVEAKTEANEPKAEKVVENVAAPVVPTETPAVATETNTESNDTSDNNSESTDVKEEEKPLGKLNNLRVIEGIGPKIAEVLQNAGIDTWDALANSEPDKIKEILNEAGPRMALHDPGTWPMQAKLAVEGKWNELRALQDRLDGGKFVD